MGSCVYLWWALSKKLWSRSCGGTPICIRIYICVGRVAYEQGSTGGVPLPTLTMRLRVYMRAPHGCLPFAGLVACVYPVVSSLVPLKSTVKTRPTDLCSILCVALPFTLSCISLALSNATFA